MEIPRISSTTFAPPSEFESCSGSKYFHEKSSLASAAKEPDPLYFRIAAHLLRPIGFILNWLTDRIALRESEMEEAEKLIENGFFGAAALAHDREKGDKILRGVLRGIDQLYHTVTRKWFPYAEVNRFMREKLILYKLIVHTYLGEDAEVHRCYNLLKGMGLPVPKQGFQEGMDFILSISRHSAQNDLKFQLLNRGVKIGLWAACVWERDSPLSLSEEDEITPEIQKLLDQPPPPPIEAEEISPPWWWKPLTILFAYPIACIDWIKNKISLTNDDMEEAEQLMEQSIEGMLEISENREKGVKILTSAIKKIENLDYKLQNKWFPKSQGNIFVRQKLLKFKIGLCTLIGNRIKIEESQTVLADLGFEFPHGPYKQWMQKILENTVKNPRNDQQIQLLNWIVLFLKDGSVSELGAWVNERLTEEKQFRWMVWASDPNGPIVQSLGSDSITKIQNALTEKTLKWIKSHNQQRASDSEGSLLSRWVYTPLKKKGGKLITSASSLGWKSVATISWNLDRCFFKSQKSQTEYQQNLEKVAFQAAYSYCVEGRFSRRDGGAPIERLVSSLAERGIIGIGSHAKSLVQRIENKDRFYSSRLEDWIVNPAIDHIVDFCLTQLQSYSS